MNYVICAVLAIIFSMVSSLVTCGILMERYSREIHECMMSATDRIKNLERDKK